MRSRFLVVCFTVNLFLGCFAVSPLMAQSAPEADLMTAATATKSNDNFVYSPQGRRDPFEPLVTKEPLVADVILKKARPDSLKGPLEKYELKQFRLLAIMVVRGVPHAMVKAPDGKSYTVKVNDYMGLNGGMVSDIQTKIIDIDQNGMRIEKSPDRIVVEESGFDGTTGKEVIDYRYIVM